MKRPLRLPKFWQKLLYVVGAFAVNIVLGLIINALFASDESVRSVVSTIVSQIAFIAEVWIGTRIFRGLYAELIEPPRSAWRATARPAAGYVIGVFLIFTVTGSIATGQVGTIYSWPAVVVYTVTAAFYLNSSIRLTRDRILWQRPTGEEPASRMF